jgi:hypothetical protein
MMSAFTVIIRSANIVSKNRFLQFQFS